MPDPPRLHSNASARPRVAPGELPGAIGITAGPEDTAPIGTAYASGWIRDDRGRLEATWRLVVRGVAIEGRWVLRCGAFVGLAEDA